MNRKNNPLVAMAALILLVVILVMACTGCTEASAENEPETMPRFIVERQQNDDGLRLFIITDTETGVQYLYFGTGPKNGGLTVLQTEKE